MRKILNISLFLSGVWVCWSTLFLCLSNTAWKLAIMLKEISLSKLSGQLRERYIESVCWQIQHRLFHFWQAITLCVCVCKCVSHTNHLTASLALDPAQAERVWGVVSTPSVGALPQGVTPNWSTPPIPDQTNPAILTWLTNLRNYANHSCHSLPSHYYLPTNTPPH